MYKLFKTFLRRNASDSNIISKYKLKRFHLAHMMLQKLLMFGESLLLVFAAIPLCCWLAASRAFASSSSSFNSCAFSAKNVFSFRFCIQSGNGLFQSSGGLSRLVHIVLSVCACMRSSLRFISLLINSSAAFLSFNQDHFWQLL